VRRLRLSLAGLTRAATPISVGIALLVLAICAVRWRALLERVSGPRERPFAAGLVGAFFATVVGALADDSGPVLVLVGAAVLVQAAGYAGGVTRPLAGRLLG
jgi:hypothetical protein